MKTLPHLKLAPWELPFGPKNIILDAPADAIVCAYWYGGEADFLIRSVEVKQSTYQCFFRDLDDEGEGNWVLNHSVKRGQIPSPEELLDCSRQILFGEVAEFKNILAQVSSKSAHAFQMSGALGYGEFLLEIHSKEEFFRLSAGFVRNEVEREFNDRQSDACFTLNFSSLGDDEIYEKILRFRCGNRQHMEGVIKWILITHTERLENLEVIRWRMLIDPTARSLIHGRYLDNKCSYHPDEWLRSFDSAVHDYFGFGFDEELCARHLCVRNLAHRQGEGFDVQVRPDQLSAHERLEAAVKLREWLLDARERGFLTAQTVEALLGDE